MAADHLKRRIGLGLLTAYGVGVMIGAGIYVLVGAVAGAAGIWAPLAFLIAGAIAAPTALSYAELSTRLPEAAGESAYIDEGLRMRWLAVLVGLAIVAAGTVSAAAVLRGGAGYLVGVIDIPQVYAVLGIGLFLVGVAVIGVLESLALAAIFTVIEVAGLGLVVWAGLGGEAVPDWSAPPAIYWPGVGVAATLAFFAFIGFEDIVNMAEEVRNPTHTVPRAILISLVVTTLIYALVAIAAIRAVEVEELAASDRPLALVWEARTGQAAWFLSLIATVAALNGVLAQIVMAARVLFGLGKRSAALRIFHKTWTRTGTPVLATVLVGGAVLIAAVTASLSSLAGATSALLLSVFVLVNAALIGLKRRKPAAPFRVPVWVPWAGLLGSVLALAAFVFGGAL